MARLYLQNLMDKDADFAIEPWADLVTLKPDESAYVEYDEPAEIGFALMADRSACLVIGSDRIKLIAPDGERTIVASAPRSP